MPKKLRSLVEERNRLNDGIKTYTDRVRELNYQIQRIQNKSRAETIHKETVFLGNEVSIKVITNVVSMLGTGKGSTHIDIPMINTIVKDIDPEVMIERLNDLINLGFIKRTVWCFHPAKGQYEEVSEETYKFAVEQVELGKEFPHNILTGDDLPSGQTMDDTITFIWVASDKYIQCVQKADDYILDLISEDL